LINASAVDNTAGFNFPLYVGASSGTAAYGRVYIDIDNDSNIRFGLSQFGESAVYTDFTYALNTTYLIVLKYTINAGDDNDEASLVVFTDPTLPASEPGSPTLGPVALGSSDPAQIARVIIRRAGSFTNDLLLDGIRVATSWSEAPLPVELVSFASSVKGNKVTLSWSTASETNNYGFEVERKHESSSWRKIGFMAGNGTTTVPRNYSFIDERLATGNYAYRLKQIDTDGQFEYSGILNVTVSLPLTTHLVQNYPNPFNPSTKIVYSIENEGLIQLMIFDISGRIVRTLINENRLPGEYSVLWNGRNDYGKRVVSGVYFYALQIGSQTTETKQMVMLK